MASWHRPLAFPETPFVRRRVTESIHRGGGEVGECHACDSGRAAAVGVGGVSRVEGQGAGGRLKRHSLRCMVQGLGCKVEDSRWVLTDLTERIYQ